MYQGFYTDFSSGQEGRTHLKAFISQIPLIGIVDILWAQHSMKLFTRVFFTTVNAFNAHTILGVQKAANERQIKSAYYSLAKQWHPDSNPGQDTSEQFQRVTKAYEVMIKEAARRSQRAPRPEKSMPSGTRSGEAAGSEDRMFKAYQAYKRKNGIRADSFHKFMEFYQDYADQKRHTSDKQEEQPQEGSFHQKDTQFDEQQEESEDHDYSKRQKSRNKKLEITVDVELSAEEAKAGSEKRLNIWKKVMCGTCHGSPPRREVKCKKCHGSGVHVSKNEIGLCWSCGGNRTVSRCECNGCGGKGQQSRQAEEVVQIRAGVGNNEELVIKGRGHQHHRKGFFGDLLVRVSIAGCEDEPEAAGLKKVGFNTYQTVKISVIEAVLGTKLKYNTVWGEKSILVRGGVQDGHVIKRNGEGCRKKSHKDSGHHFITISVEIPLKISQEETQIYERIREIYTRQRQRAY